MTFDQRIASDPAFSVWVAANAGTGKTKVLTDRVLRLLLSGVKPERILCITYTKAAAAEMEQRIEMQLGKWAITNDEDLSDILAELTGNLPDNQLITRARNLFVTLIDAAQRLSIQTIHGFCQSVLMRFPLEAKVPPHFTLIDEQTSAQLLKEAKEKFLCEPDGIVNASIAHIASLAGEYVFNDLIVSIIKDRSKFTQWFSTSDGKAHLISELYARNGLSGDETAKTILQKIFHYNEKETADLRHACAALAESEAKSDTTTFYALNGWLNRGETPSVGTIENYVLALLTKQYEPRKTTYTKNTVKLFPAIEAIVQAEQQRVLRYTTALQALQNVELNTHVITIAYALLKQYHQLKNYHCYLDYDDLIIQTALLLQQPSGVTWVLYKLDSKIEHILLDEAQDTSPLQWQIMNALTQEFFAGEGAQEKQRTVFVVGDGKQSIYSFQGADPQHFDSEQMKLRKRVQSAGHNFKNIRLALSFRSTAAVLQAVDDVFATQASSDGLVFQESIISHEAYRKGQAGRVEIWPLLETVPMEPLPPYYVAKEPEIAERVEVTLAKKIAATIKSWFDEKRKLLSQDRVIVPGDIIILIQKRSGYFIPAMIRALTDYSIAVSGTDRLTLTDHIAVQDCITLAHFLLLPDDDLTLAVILKSPFIGLSEEDLFTLAYDRAGQTLWQRLRAFSHFPEEDNATKSCYDAAYTYLSDLLAKVDYLQPYELFAYILETRGGRKQLCARLGKEINDPLNELLALAIEYGTLHTPTLQGFLQWLNIGDIVIKRDMEHGVNEIRIMTVHGAKGLQAPIVFLPDTVRLPTPKTGIMWSEDNLPVWSPSADYESTYCRELRDNLRLVRDREYRRLLYVAMTRAEDELYVCGWKSTLPVQEKSWYEMIKQGIAAASAKGDSSWQEIEANHVLTSPQLVAPGQKEVAKKQSMPVILPNWLNQPAPFEPIPAKPLSPSQLEEESKVTQEVNPGARMRGVMLHRLLQYLPDISLDKRDAFIARLGGVSEEAEKIKSEVNAILNNPEFTPFFSKDSIAEAPISGIVMDAEGKAVTISGQIDRLLVTEDKVYIIDYKTGSKIPDSVKDIPGAYIKQMNAYRKLMEQIYPNKEIICALLFTAAPKVILV